MKPVVGGLINLAVGTCPMFLLRVGSWTWMNMASLMVLEMAVNFLVFYVELF